MKITLLNNPYTGIYNSYSYENRNNRINKRQYLSQPSADAFKPLNTRVRNISQYPFTGVTRLLPQIKINTVNDAIGQWEKLKFSPYYEALDDKFYPQNKVIRKANFSFLDNMSSEIKKEFIHYFEKLTGFPNLKKVSENIEHEFLRQVFLAADKVSHDVKIAAAGYDPTCSVGLQRSFPGSDLDKAYVVLENRSNKNSFNVINEFKSHLWYDTDQRILSLNNEDTFPEVYTMDGISYTLNKLDKVVKKLNFSDDTIEKFMYLRRHELDPVKGGLFNIYVAKNLPFEDISKEYAKNFAYFIESVRDGKALAENKNYINDLEYCIQYSPFAQYSNVTQMGAHDTVLSSGLKQIKTKLQNRGNLSAEYGKMSTDEKFELIKEIIKSVSKDNDNPEFNKYFQNDDNIKERYDRLNRLLLQ